MSVEQQGITAEESAAQPEHRRLSSGITPRAVIIGFIAIIPGVFWGVYGDVVSQTDLTSPSLMMPRLYFGIRLELSSRREIVLKVNCKLHIKMRRSFLMSIGPSRCSTNISVMFANWGW